MASKSSSRKSKQYRGENCLNCGHPLDLSDLYCPSCSQMNTNKPLSLRDFFDEFFSSIFTYDSRLRYTLRDLMFKPGTITLNYVRGQRLKYANPFRFFLSVSISYFLLQGIAATLELKGNATLFKTVTVTNENSGDQTSEMVVVPLDSIIDGNEKDPVEIPGDSATGITEKEEIRLMTESELDTLQMLERFYKRFNMYRSFYKKTGIRDPVIALDSLNHTNTGFNRWVYSKNKSADRMIENPVGFGNYLLSKIPFFLFLFAPVFALVFKLVYSRKEFNFMEHLIFIFHLFSFVFLTMLISLVPDLIIGTEFFLSISILIVTPIYFYKSLRKFYRQSRLKTLLKFVVLGIVYFISANLAALLFIILTAAAY